MTARKDKKGPRYVAMVGDERKIIDTHKPQTFWLQGAVDAPMLLKLLNAGERARQQVKCLKAELEHLRDVAGTYCPCKVCTR